jgi:hypothetical protein
VRWRFAVVAGVAWAANATAELPSRDLALACRDEVRNMHAAPAQAGLTCSAFLQAVGASRGDAGDRTYLLDALGHGDEDTLADYLANLPIAAPGAMHLDTGAVSKVLSGLPDASQKPHSWWERLVDWLQATLAPTPSPHQPPPAWMSWLQHLLSWIPTPVVNVVSGALALVLIGILIAIPATMVWLALRDVRWLGSEPQQPWPASATPLPTLAEIAAVAQDLPSRERPGALLRWVIARLGAAGVLPATATLTNRELHSHLSPPLAEPFAALVALAERAIYGERSLAPTELDHAVALAQALTSGARSDG